MQWDHYRRKALECARAAAECGDPLERLRLLAVARQFVLLAGHVGVWCNRDAGCAPGVGRQTSPAHEQSVH